MKEKLSVIIPCKDESRNIRGCVEGVREIADEIIVADSGSTDDTLEIVRSIGGCRIIEREFIGYASFKNWAIPQASHPWVLIVDADERPSEKLAAEIRQVLENPPEALDGFWISFECFFMGHRLKYSHWNTAAFRLFRRDRCRYGERKIHEEIEVAADRAGRLRGTFEHYSYWNYDQYFEKWVRYTRLGAQEMHERGKRTGFVGLLVRPMLRFFQLYIFKLGFLDGLPGLQVCMLTAFFNTFIKQARLWELDHARTPDGELIAAKKPSQAAEEAGPKRKEAA